MTTQNWITDKLPDSEMTVLLRVEDEENFVWPGFHDGEVWCWVDGSVVSENVPVLGWMELEDAAAILDTARLIDADQQKGGR